MNILLINHYAGSPYYGMEYRPYYLAKEWIKQGHIVTIIAASYSHLRQVQPDINEDFQEEIIDGIKYVWFNSPKYNSAVSRIYNILSFTLKLCINSKKISKLYNPDVVIASSTYTLDNIPAFKIAKLANAKYVYEIHDLWPLSPMLIGGYSKYHPFIQIMQYGENYAYKHADKVVSLLWNAEEHCKEHGLPSGKFICIPNGYNPIDWENNNKDIPYEHKTIFNELKDKIIIGFAGGFARSGAVRTIIDVANTLKKHTNLHFILVGKGPEKDIITKMISNYNLSNVTILPSVSKFVVPRIINNFDIAYMGGVHSLLHKYGTSYNKMTDYLLSAKPIIHAIDEPGCVVEKVGCGIQVEAENPELIALAILKIASMTEYDRKIMGEQGKVYAKENLQWSILANKFIQNI